MSISRRRFLTTALTAGASGVLLSTRAPIVHAATPDLLVLENDHCSLWINRENGCLDRLASKDHAWNFTGGGLRLHVPAPEHRYHYLTERNTNKPKIESEGKRATITWNGFKSERLGELDIEVKETIRLEGEAAEFSYEIRNGSNFVIESYSYPRLTGLKPSAGTKTLRQVAWGYSGMASADLWPIFASEVGYWGSDTPALVRNLGADTQFCLVLAEDRGVYVGYHDQSQKQIAQLSFSLVPAYADSFNSYAPDPSGKVTDPAISIDANHLCFIAPGTTQRSEDLIIEPFRGTWHAGVDIYKNWRRTWFKTPRTPQWAKEVHSWQQIQINSSEDRLEFPYKDLTLYAEACKRWGVKAIQLTGWQAGGQDRNYPLHDIDPRLGTAEELKSAIAKAKKMGVEVVLFNKYAWADVTDLAYERDFRRFVIEDPYGKPYVFNGYNYDTPTQLAGINARHGAGMCTASPAWRKRALEEFRKSADLGASGILFDECLSHLSPYCFSKNHGHPVPGAVFSGDVALIDGFRTVVNPDEFLFAGESPYDIELQTYGMSYFRIGSWGSTAFARYIDPFAPMSVAVTGFNDRHMINCCLLFRYCMSYEPRNFHGELDEMPDTMQYGRAVDDLRRRYKEWIWDAEFRDTLGAKVLAGGKLHTAYTVFHRKDGSRAVAFANMSDTEHILCEVVFENTPSSSSQLISPEEPELKPWAGKLELAPGHAAVVVES